MANDILNISSASTSSGVFSDKSGRLAAPTLSEVLPVQETEKGSAIRNVQTPLSKTEKMGSLNSRDDEKKRNEITAEDLKKQAQDLQELSKLKGWAVNFEVDQDLNQTIIKVVDAETQKTIRQIPNEELLTISKRLQAFRNGQDSLNSLSGLFFDKEI